jgi:hypothetical protein
VGQKVVDLLKRKKASIKQTRLPHGSPVWDAFMEMAWEQIEAGARANGKDVRSFASCELIRGLIDERAPLSQTDDILEAT